MRTAKPLSTPLLALALLLGCGGHSSPSVLAAKRAGHVSLTIHWPAPARYIPSAANFVRVQILDASGTVVDTVQFMRGQAGQDYAQTITNEKALPGGATYTLSAQAYSGITDAVENGLYTPDGNALSAGTASVTVVAGATTNQSVTMASQLAGFSVALTSLTTGQAIGTYPISPGSTPPTTLPSVSVRDVLGVSVTPLNAAAGTLTLYPTNSATPGLSTVGSLAAGGQAASGMTLTGALAPTSVSTSTGALVVSFSDAGTPTLSANLPVSVAGVDALAFGTTDVRASIRGTGFPALSDAIASSSEGTYFVQRTGASESTTTSLVRLAGGNPTVVQDLGTTPVDELAALPGGQAFYSSGSKLYKANGVPVDSGHGVVIGLAALRDKVYALCSSLNDNAATVVQYAAADLSGGTATPLNNEGASSVGSFSVGPAPDGSVAFYTVESGVVRRYVGGIGTPFVASVAGETIEYVAVDGNVVWVYDYSNADGQQDVGSLRGYLASTGALFSDLSISGKAHGLSAGGAQGALVIENGGGPDDIRPFAY